MHAAPHILEQAAEGNELGQAFGCLIATAIGFQDSGIASIPTCAHRPTHSGRLLRFMAAGFTTVIGTCSNSACLALAR